MSTNDHALWEFHVSRQARTRYQFNEALFASHGNVVFTNFHAARVFAKKINDKRDLVNFPEQAVRAGQINAMGLIDEILHMVVHLYRQQMNPQVMLDALDWLYGLLGQEAVDLTLRRFAEEFPPMQVYQRELSLDEYLAGESLYNETLIPNRLIVLEEMLMLWLANANPAFAPFQELFDDSYLDKESAYRQIIPSLRAFFETQPNFGPDNLNLLDMLRSPAVAVPHSLSGQLEYIRERWGGLLGRYLYRLLSSLDLIQEEEKAIFFGPGPARVYEFGGLEVEPERFSQDREWMPSLVLLAKNAYVWLDQLSKKHQQNIIRLDQIPDEELDRLARWGITGLWLIGLWERSAASKRIKQLRGNPDAVASAYSLYDYQIAEDLGGEEAYQSLRARAWQRGIRLSSDMVPNHMGIDSRWVIEHPDWFIQLDYSPFPSYSFNGPNLSTDERVGLYLEDHYYDNSDAAVVFKRVDHFSGHTRYLYHGNDGTSMPWNDTAQLNYLMPQVREAVIQTILHVARMFPIIRFDAAMTLAKKHFQRLWFPEPGSGGDIPTRAEFGLTKGQFDELIPVEFWREVVDRVAQEVPDTLLLAEAFWLMEGYFVRTLGMHRVYNSAFMNMLRDEKNAEYRLVIKNTLEFDPEILKRYVNFMSNPDERTAVDQFGKDDKYFGVCTLMATMPGLPMIGHGQVEGFTEKYGMEYRRAYWEETPDSFLIDRHEREIFPLLRKRYLFAEVNDFLLYDFYTPEGHVNEDVFAYSNRSGDERSLVIYHNKFASSRGWVRTSAAFSVKSAAGERTLMQKSLGEGLGLTNAANHYCIFRDLVSGLEYIRNSREIYEKGLYAELEAYKCQVFVEFREVVDDQWRQYAHLAEYLQGRGVPDIREAMREVFLQPIHHRFRELVNPGLFHWIVDNRLTVAEPENENIAAVLQEVDDKNRLFLAEIKSLTQAGGDPETLVQDTHNKLVSVMSLPLLNASQEQGTDQDLQAQQYLFSHLDNDPLVWSATLTWTFIHNLGKISLEDGYADISRSWIDEWLLGKIVAGALQDMQIEQGAAWRTVSLIKILTAHHTWYLEQGTIKERADLALQSWLKDTEVQRYLGVNRYQDVLWFNKESLDELLWWMYAVALIQVKSEPEMTQDILSSSYQVVKHIQAASEASGYKVEKLLEKVKA
ncbi:MAG: alpha-amylase family glycosyl hydrolase [Anaerolineales bacterium]|jgi:glycosidase